MKKYELTDETLECNDHMLRRIKALVDIPEAYVAAGSLGGWLECEENLSQKGNCWVFKDAKVYGNANVSGNAIVDGMAEVFEDAKVYGNANVHEEAEVYGKAVVSGDAWVYGRARVYGKAVVSERASVGNYALIYGNAVVNGNAEVRGDIRLHGDVKVSGFTEVCGKAILCDGVLLQSQDYACFGPIGSRNAFTTLNKTTGTVCTGCFDGSLDEFEKAVEGTYGDTVYGIAYKNLINYFKTLIAK